MGTNRQVRGWAGWWLLLALAMAAGCLFKSEIDTQPIKDKLAAKDWNGAEAAAKAVLAKDAENFDAKTALAQIQRIRAEGALVEQARAAAAAKEWDKALELVGQVPLTSPHQGEAQKAKEEFAASYATFHLNLATKAKEAGQLEKALGELDLVFSVEPQNAAGRSLDQAIQKALAGPKSALPSGNEASVVDAKKEARELHQSGIVQLKDGEYAKAVEAFARALDLDPNLCSAKVLTGDAYARWGKKKEAGAAYVKFLNTCPTDKRAPEVRKQMKKFQP